MQAKVQKASKLDLIITRLGAVIETRATTQVEEPLPAVRSLAESLQTSTKTVVRALRHMVEKDSLRQDPVNGRYYLPTADPRGDGVESLNKKSEGTSDALTNRIIDDLLTKRQVKDGTIPSVSQLRRMFHCSHGRIRTTLEIMVKDGLLKPEGRGFRFNTPMPASMQHSRIFVTGLPRFLYNFPFCEIFREIELALENQNWPEPGYLLRDQKSDAPYPPDHKIAGFIALHHSLCVRHDIAPYLTKPAFPQVVIDPSDALDKNFSVCSDITKIGPDNAYAGRAMGMHLLRTGHRKIAFFTHVPLKEGWISRRLKGLQSVFPNRPGQDGSVEVFDASETAGHSGSHLKSLRYLMAGTLRESKKLANEMLFPSGDFIHSNTVRPLSAIITLANLSRMLHPVFETALRHAGCSAWVCVNDDIAALAHEYLRENRREAVRKTAIVGFDNLPHSRMIGLTSFDFAYEKMGRIAANSFLFPAATHSRRLIRVRGNLIVRSSSQLE